MVLLNSIPTSNRSNGMQLSIEINAKPLQDLLFELSQGKQVPFALSKSLNDLAKTAQTDIRLGIEQRFKLNRKAFVFNSIKIDKERRATKTSLVVTIRVTDNAQFLADMEAGAQHLPGFGRKLLALPNPAVFKGRPITKANPLSIGNLGLHKTSRGVEGAQETFLVRTKGSLLRGLILQATSATHSGKGKRRKVGTGQSGNRVLYTLITRSHRPAKLQFIQPATKGVQEQWEPVFKKNILAAIQSAKRN